ncbi:hypothetical protein AMJ86_09830 [bacterium SM23_57]|nr:MAG: hypothetical protein AMJ86_09830 [bacterium SM23_57]
MAMWLGQAFALACIVIAFIVVGIRGRVVLVGILLLMAVFSVVFPEYRLWLRVAWLLLGIGCAIYLLASGYMKNIRMIGGPKK